MLDTQAAAGQPAELGVGLDEEVGLGDDAVGVKTSAFLAKVTVHAVKSHGLWVTLLCSLDVEPFFPGGWRKIGEPATALMASPLASVSSPGRRPPPRTLTRYTP